MWLHQVDRGYTHEERCPTKTLEALSCTISPRVEGQSVSKTASIPFVLHSTKDGLT